jgi:prepilin-type processing-associated H-X9-DG protein
MPTTGLNPWDLSIDMVPGLAPFGLTVPMWFCPVRPDEFQEAADWFRNHNVGRSLSSVADLNAYLTSRFGSFALLHHDWWVPRTLDGDPKRLFPAPGLTGTRTRTKDGWPRFLEDRVAALQPIISDLVGAEGFQTNLAKASGGHALGKAPGGDASVAVLPWSTGAMNIQSINRAYADGHVETAGRARILWQHFGNWTTFY